MRLNERAAGASGSERGTASMVAIIGLFAVAMGFVMVSLTTSKANREHASDMREQTESHFVASAGLNTAVYEIVNHASGFDQADDGDGHFGSVGVLSGAPMEITGANNRKIGEFKTYLINTAGLDATTPNDLTLYDPQAEPPFYELRVLAAIPSFADQRRTYMMQASLGSNASFLFAPKSGAVSISGPVNHMSLSYWDDSAFSITGGSYPAFVFTDQVSLNEAIDEIGDEARDGHLTVPLTEVTGTPSIEYDHHDYPTQGGNNGSLQEFDLSAIFEPGATFTAQMMNDYRDALRAYAQKIVGAVDSGNGSSATATIDYTNVDANGKMTTANYPSLAQDVLVLHEHPDVKDGAGSKKPRITQNLSGAEFGTTGNPATVVVDTSEFYQGGSKMTDNHNRTLSGVGDLVIMHPIGSFTDNNNGKQFNLNWEGNVWVIGYPIDRSSGAGANNSTDNLLYLSRADWNVTGNLIAVTAGATEASLEMQGTNANPANLTVNGSLLMFAEATGQESEIDIEQSAYMTVNGIAGMFGSRIELEDQDSTKTQIHVNGTFIMGLPAGNTRTDDFYWRTRGSTQFTYSQANASAAALGLSQLQSNLVFSSNTLTSLQLDALHVVNITDPQTWTLWNTQLATLEAGGLASASDPAKADARGVDLDLFD